MQIKTHELESRKAKQQPGTQSEYTETVLGLLPMSHIYSLVVICHASIYRGDQVLVLPKFDFAQTLEAVQKYKIATLFLVSCLLPSQLTTASLTLQCIGPTHHHPHDQEQGIAR